jgi:DNA polymerase-3 subunit delta'
VEELVYPDLWYLFPHPSSVGPETTAELAREKMRGERVGYQFAASASIPLADVRLMQKNAGLRSLEGGWKVFVLREANRLTEEASNALLKTLEEAPPKTAIFLTSSATHALRPTVVSRCQRVPLGRLSVQQVASVLTDRLGIDEDVMLWARLGRGSPARAWELAKDERTQAARAVSAELLSASLEEDRGTSLRLVEQIAATRDRGFAEAVLVTVLGLCRDTLAQRTAGATLVENVDYAELVEQYGARRGPEEVERACESIIAACVAVRRNVNLRLAVLSVLPYLRGETVCRNT